MKAAVVSWTPQLVRKELKKAGIKETRSHPDIVIAFGGEGTFLFSEQKYPGIPKLFIRHKRTCKKSHNLLPILNALKRGAYVIENHPKLQAVVNNQRRKTLVCMNDINIHYVPPMALRFSVKINGRKVADNVIGDGLIIATPYGSSAYYKSITRSTFSNGIGVAFNNPVKPHKPLKLKADSKIEVKIIRGPGVLAADCCRKLIKLKEGDVIRIKKHKSPARIIHLRGRKLKIEKY